MKTYQAIKDDIVQQDHDQIEPSLQKAMFDIERLDKEWEAESLAHQFINTTEPREQAGAIAALLTMQGNQEELLDLVYQHCDELLFAYSEQRVWEDQQQLITTDGEAQ